MEGQVQLSLENHKGKKAAQNKRRKANNKAILDDARASAKRAKSQLSIEDYPRLGGEHRGNGAAKGGGRGDKAKGGGKGKGKALPPGAVTAIPETMEPICHKFNKGNCSFGAACKFKQVCWFCFATHPGEQCTSK